MKSRQNGFTILEILIVVVALGLVGTVGWLVIDRNKDQQKTGETIQENTQDDQVTEENETSNQTDEQDTSYSKVSSTKCTDLNTQDSIAAGTDGEWKTRIEATDTVKEFDLESDPADAELSTYFGNICALSDGSTLLTYSHYFYKQNTDNTLTLVANKGVAHFDEANNEIVTIDGILCENAAPDETSPASINSVDNGVASITCGGYSAEKISYNLTTQKFDR